jgi:formylglycine-generating enzyme required for sulfatase activity
MTRVEAGVFLSGSDNESVWLPTFWLDVFPTTNAEYARFAAATGRPAPRHWPGGKCPDDLFDHPVVWVTWHDAAAYAAWSGKSLPTNQQWEKAARGLKAAPTRGETGERTRSATSASPA